MEHTLPHVSTLSQYVVDEILLTVGLAQNRWGRKLTSPFFALPSRRLSQIALAFDAQIEQVGLRAAFAGVLPHFANGFQVWGEKNIPEHGPLLVIANHPGTVDSILISSLLPREDLKIVAGFSPFTQALPTLREHLIFSSRELNQRAMVIRAGIQHLKAGGAMLLFPGGRIEPDPACLPGACESLGTWSRSVELFLRQVPETHLVGAVVSHVLLPQFLHHPLVRFRKSPEARQRVAEFFQTIYQLMFAKRYLPTPRVSFSEPVCAGILPPTGKEMTPNILAFVRQLFHDHLTYFGIAASVY
jgi:hypothetical protein